MQPRTKIVLAGICAAVVISGCASTMLSDDRIASETAGVLGVSPSDVTILNRRTEMTNTYYLAKTKKGNEFSCVISGGNLLSAGMVNPPVCGKKGEPLNANPFARKP